jgi:hypothetical protein
MYLIVVLRPVPRPFPATLPQHEKGTRQMSTGAE